MESEKDKLNEKLEALESTERQSHPTYPRMS